MTDLGLRGLRSFCGISDSGIDYGLLRDDLGHGSPSLPSAPSPNRSTACDIDFWPFCLLV